MSIPFHLVLAAAAALAWFVPAFCAAEDVPFVTTPDKVTLAMLEAAKVNRRDYVIDLGSGDGRIVIVAAKRFGARGLGVEIVPHLVKLSRQNAARAGVEDRARFVEQDLFKTDLGHATVVTLYLLPDVNLELRPKLLELKPGTRIVSHDWDMGEWQPDKTLTLDVPDKKVGIEKKSRVHLWIVPARIDGEWCGTGSSRDMRLTIRQQFQHVQADLAGAGSKESFIGQLEGSELRGARLGDAPIGLKHSRKRLVLTRGGGLLSSSSRASVFVRRKGASCR